MNGVHDMGGMHGFGPIERDPAATDAHPASDLRVRALMYLTTGAGLYHLDAFRYGIERMPPAAYLRASYYERWLTSIVSNLIEAGVLTDDELAARMDQLRQQPDTVAAASVTPAPVPPPAVAPVEPSPPAPPRFAVGDAVVARNIHATGHTRLPRYIRGKRGVIQLSHGAEIFPDTNAHRLGQHPQSVYNVRFDGRELWGDAAEPHHVVSIDLWESYLEPALNGQRA